MLKYGLALAAAGLIALNPANPSGAMAGPAQGSPEKNIVQVAREAGQFRTLITALQAADLIGTLSGQGKGTFTVFAPTDAAFQKLDPSVLQGLLDNPVALRDILLYHVVPGTYDSGRVLTTQSLTTANGKTLTVGPGATVNGANIVAVDIAARNGVIHVIDTVLLPPQ